MGKLPPLTFIAHAPENEREAEALARRLRDEAGVAVWFAPWSIEAGDNPIEEMERALLAAKVCVVCISDPGGRVTGWQSQNMQVSIMRRVRERAVRVIPLLLPGTARPRAEDLPLFLQLYEPVVFRSLDDEAAFQKLLRAVLRELDAQAAPAPGRLARAAHPPAPCADLELRLSGLSAPYVADAQLTPPENAFVADLAGAVPVSMDSAALLAAGLSPEEYGRRLTAMLFADPRLRSAWVQARAFAHGAGAALRLRLRLDGGAQPLHSLRWELLQDPLGHGPIALGEQVRFTRYLSSADLTPLARPARAELRALLAIASPTDLPIYGLAPIDAAGEEARARAVLAAPPAILARAFTGAPVTIDAIVAALRERPHLLYLICHGSSVGGEAYLWLEQADGTSQRLPAARLAQALTNLSWRPPLVVLASCGSGGPALGDPWDPSALGPLLARASVAAVVAMQGPFSLQALERFTPAFLAELSRDGMIDRALAATRAALQDGQEWWLPALFLRARDGSLWAPGERPTGA